MNHCLSSILALSSKADQSQDQHMKEKKSEFKQEGEYIGHLKSILMKLMIYNEP